MPLPERPIQISAFSEVGASGLRWSGGYIQEEFLTTLQGQNGNRVKREMADNDPLIGGSLALIKGLIRQVDWHVDPADKSAKAQQYAQFVDECREDMSYSWSDTIAEALSCIEFGFAPMELVYKRRTGVNTDNPGSGSRYTDGAIGWRKIAIRAQETVTRWDLDDNGGIQGLYQQAAPFYFERYIPIEKMLLFRVRPAKNNPEGVSMLRSAYWPYYIGKKLAEISSIGAERDLAGIPVGRVPMECLTANATSNQQAVRTAMQGILEKLHQHEQAFILLGSDKTEQGEYMMDVQLLKAAGARQFDVKGLLEMWDLRKVQAMLTDVIMVGHEKTGSFALAGNKFTSLAVALTCIVDSVADVFNRHGIPRLAALNGWDPALCPKLSHGEIEIPDLSAIGALLDSMSKAGVDVFPDEVLTRHLYTLAKLPTEGRDEIERQGTDPNAPRTALGEEPTPPPTSAPVEEPEQDGSLAEEEETGGGPKEAVSKGDFEGHPFRGNQWTGGSTETWSPEDDKAWSSRGFLMGHKQETPAKEWAQSIGLSPTRLKQIISRERYPYFGLRADRDDLSLGDTLNPSREMLARDEETGEMLGGTSVVGIPPDGDVEDYAAAIGRDAFYYGQGRTMYLVGSKESGGSGHDPGEELLIDPVVLAVFRPNPKKED